MADVFAEHRPGIPFQPVAELLAQYRRRDPGRLAIVDLDQKTSISWGALERAVTDIAAALAQRGVSHGSRVLLLSDEALEKLLIWLACWRLGAVVVPLNIELNEQLIGDLAGVIDPALALVHVELDGGRLLAGRPFVAFGRYSGSAADADPADGLFRTMTRGIAPEQLPARNEAADIACIFCTSGTTSRPKLVVYDHCAYWLNGLSTLEALGLSEDDRTLEYRSFGWNSAQVVSLMPFLEKGLTMHIARRFSHSRFFEWIRRAFDHLRGRRAHGRQHAAEQAARLHRRRRAEPAIDDLQHRPAVARAVDAVRGHVRRQAAADVRHVRGRLDLLQPPLPAQDGNGRRCGAAPGARDRRPAGQGVPAQCRGRGDGGRPQCAVGYLLDDGTIEAIRGRRIKSGDLASMDEDGFVRVSGRTKDLIIRGGVNIAPQEIDAVLLAHPAVADAAAVGVPDETYGEEVICYVVPQPGGDLSAQAVAEHCRARLPVPKRPKQIFIVADLPKSDRGKVLRDKLKEDWRERGKQPG